MANNPISNEHTSAKHVTKDTEQRMQLRMYATECMELVQHPLCWIVSASRLQNQQTLTTMQRTREHIKYNCGQSDVCVFTNEDDYICP